MKIKTAEAIGPALDWLVAKCEGYLDDQLSWLYEATLQDVADGSYHPSSDWAQGGPIIEREKLQLEYMDNFNAWACSSGISVEEDQSWDQGYGPTPLIAAMRCYVASKLGDEVEIPKETNHGQRTGNGA